jgi:hypothetical protein
MNPRVLIESGHGSVEGYYCISEDGVGMMCLDTGEPGPIGGTRPIREDVKPNESQVVWAFHNVESLDVVIEQFIALRELMTKYNNDELDFEEAT